MNSNNTIPQPTPFSQKEALFRSQKHPFHILGPSPFPALVALSLFCWLLPQVFYFHGLPFAGIFRSDIIHASILAPYLTVMSGFISIVKESSQGFHTKKVQQGLRLGMLLFILSEVMFFFAFFGGFFHFSLNPSIVIGNIWPPYGTQQLMPGGLPFANTMLLLASGVTITIAHAYIVKNNVDGFFGYLFLTIVLGVTFLFCQAFEYKHGVKFSGVGNIYGSIFFVTTGFHGLHVTIGTLFLTFCWLRHLLATILPLEVAEGNYTEVVEFLQKYLEYQPAKGFRGAFTPTHHFGFEAAAGYWHFVDVVGLFLFVTVYGGGGQ